MSGTGGADWSVHFFIADDGSSPVREFLRSLDRQTRARFGWSIDQLQIRNLSAREPLVKKLGGSL